MVQRILVTCGLAIAGLAAFLIADPAVLSIRFPLLGTVSVSTPLLLPLVSVLAAFCAAYDLADGPRQQRLDAALPPALLTLGFFFAGGALEALLPAGPLLFLAGLGCSLALVLAAAWGGRWPRPVSAFISPLAIYISAYVLMTGILALRLRALLSAPAVGLAGAVLALLLWRAGQAAQSLERGAPGSTARELVLGCAVGLVVAQVAWALLFLPVSALLGGLILLAVFYAASGMLSPGADKAAPWPLAAEYALVALAAVAAVVLIIWRMR